MIFLNKRIHIELLILFVLAYIGWGMASLRRFGWKDIDGEDCVDLLFSYFMAVSGYYLFQWIIAFFLKRETERKRGYLFQTFGVACFVVIVWETLINLPYTHFYYQQSLWDTSFPRTDLPLTVLVLLGLSVLFYQKDQFSRQYASHTQARSKLPKDAAVTYTRAFVLQKGKDQVQIQDSEIVGFFIREKFVWLLRKDGQQFLTSFSLKELEPQLDPTVFFRVNRQMILAKDAVDSYQALSNQKLAISTHRFPDLEGNIIVSKYTAAAFKKWLAHSS